jgi:hypothetical protein
MVHDVCPPPEMEKAAAAFAGAAFLNSQVNCIELGGISMPTIFGLE